MQFTKLISPCFFSKKSWQQRGRPRKIPVTGQIGRPVRPVPGSYPMRTVQNRPVTSQTGGPVHPAPGSYPMRTMHYLRIPQVVRTEHRVRGPYLIRAGAPAPKRRVAWIAVRAFRDGNVPGTASAMFLK